VVGRRSGDGVMVADDVRLKEWERSGKEGEGGLRREWPV
jgi:hypothetical protein